MAHIKAGGNQSVSNENRKKRLSKFDSSAVAGECLVVTGTYPFTMGKTLIQMGYEPIKPVHVRTIFGTPKLSFPNIFKYLNHIRQEDGFLGLYRGLGYKLMTVVADRSVSTLVYNQLEEQLMTRLRKLQNFETEEEGAKSDRQDHEATEKKNY